MPTLQYKTALVTGASRGIGRATALALAKAGAHALVHYDRSTQEAKSVVAEIQTKGGRADAISADLGTPDGASLPAKQVRSIVGDRLDVLVAGRTVAESTRALRLEEKGYPPVYYLPRSDADMSLLVRTTHYTYCPYKGDCTYYSIPIGGSRSENAVWTYEKPHEAATEIKEHLAFYPSRIDAIEAIS